MEGVNRKDVSMSFKPRFESLELKILRYLDARMELAEKDDVTYYNLG